MAADTFTRPNGLLTRKGALPGTGRLALALEGRALAGGLAIPGALLVGFLAVVAAGLYADVFESVLGGATKSPALTTIAVWGGTVSCFVACAWLFSVETAKRLSIPALAFAVPVTAAVLFAGEQNLPAVATSATRYLYGAAAALALVVLARTAENMAAGRPRLQRGLWATELVGLAVTAAAVAQPLFALGWAYVVPPLALAAFAVAPQARALLGGAHRVPKLDASASSPPAAPDTGTGFDQQAVAAPAGPAEAQVRPPPAVERPARSLGDVLDELDRFPGLDAVKRQVRDLTSFLAMQEQRRAAGLKGASGATHLRFEGPPGTGKTTMARLVADAYRSLDLLSRGHLIEATRADLVGQYQGTTAQKVNELLDAAQGGVLFIDEAYALAAGEQDNFGREALETLIKRMEDDRADLVVILAGYPEEMARLMDSNPGLRSRCERVITFPHYSADELVDIADKFAADGDYEWTPEARQTLAATLTDLYEERDRHWGNAREVRKVFEATVRAHARRLHGRDVGNEDLRRLTGDDVREAAADYRAERDADRGTRQPALLSTSAR